MHGALRFKPRTSIKLIIKGLQDRVALNCYPGVARSGIVILLPSITCRRLRASAEESRDGGIADSALQRPDVAR